jgi:uncharacterized protein (TIGR02145 family)
MKIKLSLILLVSLSIFSCKKDTPAEAPQKKPDIPITAVPDVDGNNYKFAVIGTQVWMTENLKTTKYRNGDLIGTTTPVDKDISTELKPKYQWAYDGADSNLAVYGRLYTWYATVDTRNICPTGWHVPTDQDWNVLITQLGGSLVAGGKMKEMGYKHWPSPNTGADNSSGFTGLPGGFRYASGLFVNYNFSGDFWSTMQRDSLTAKIIDLRNSKTIVGSGAFDKSMGLSIRCIKD